jgi:GMP synthase (glutamine-hydrolysing)
VDGGKWAIVSRGDPRDLIKSRPKRRIRTAFILVGSQFTQLIARRVREAHVYSEIHPPTRTLDWIREWDPKGIILSGGPSSVYDPGAPLADPALLDMGIPVLGLCYGMQLVAHLAGATVKGAARREYGRAAVTVLGVRLFKLLRARDPGLDEPRRSVMPAADSWPRHRRPRRSPAEHRSKPIHAVQFHPKSPIPAGDEIIQFPLRRVRLPPDWTAGHFIETETARITPGTGRPRSSGLRRGRLVR